MKVKPILVAYMPLRTPEELDGIQFNLKQAVRNEYHVVVVAEDVIENITLEVLNADKVDPILLDELLKKLNGEQEQD